MKVLAVFTFATAALAAPASLLSQLSALTRQSESCVLPEVPANCAGSAMKDVIIQYGQASGDQKKLVFNVAKSSGGNVIWDYQDFGFSGLVPEPIIELIKAHGQSFGLQVFENACAEIPWCGEAPC